MEDFQFSVPMIPPSVNSYWKVRRFGGRYVTPEGVAFKKLVAEAVKSYDVSVSSEVKYKLRVELYRPDWMTKKDKIKIFDLDNYGKCLCDALFNALAIDDSQVWDLRLLKKDGLKNETRFFLSEFGD